NPFAAGQWDSVGLAHQSFQLAFTPGVTAMQYAGLVTDAEFATAGDTHFPGILGDAHWWLPSGTSIYPADPRAHFFLPIVATDSMGLETVVTRDQYDLLME